MIEINKDLALQLLQKAVDLKGEQHSLDTRPCLYVDYADQPAFHLNEGLDYGAIPQISDPSTVVGPACIVGHVLWFATEDDPSARENLVNLFASKQENSSRLEPLTQNGFLEAAGIKIEYNALQVLEEAQSIQDGRTTYPRNWGTAVLQACTINP